MQPVTVHIGEWLEGVRPLESSSKLGLAGEHQIETAGTLYWWYG